jgi:isopentenyl diphosphate isomerase/L-lactate dehydrogenase-like FMN-dependent dehydrogenase
MPRMLVDTNTRDISTTIFGKKISAPIAFSPVGINKVSEQSPPLRTAKGTSNDQHAPLLFSRMTRFTIQRESYLLLA